MPQVELIHVSRSFPGVLALQDVSFELQAGEVHALVGENGAGKSTLINILSGVLQPDAGQLLLAGNTTHFPDPVAARNQGIVTVHQEAELFPTLSVSENMALGQGLPTRWPGRVAWATVETAANKAVAQLGENIDIDQPASRLSVAQRHMTQVAAAVEQQAAVVILDEPTSALTQIESEWLFAQIARLKQAGAGILYVSHRQEEVFRLADRITVLRDGARVWTRDRGEVTPDLMIQAMVGRQVENAPPSTKPLTQVARDGEPAFRIESFTDVNDRFRDVDLAAWAGEIVGVFGLVGSGRSETAQAIFGLRRCQQGRIYRNGKICHIQRPQDAVQSGIAYLPEDRLRQGVCRGLSVRANAVLSSLQRWTFGPFASSPAEQHATQQLMDQLQVRHRSIHQPLAQLSGGNQQKVVLGRWLLTCPEVLILDEPTRGVDIGSKREIHNLLRQLADDGCAIVMISSELPEIMQNSDRVVVFCNGQVAAQLDPRTSTAEEIAAAALPNKSSQKDVPVPGKFSSLGSLLPRSEFALLGVVLVLCSWLMATSDGFRPWEMLTGTITSLWILLGLSAACVILAGGIDISIGSLMALSAVCAALVLKLPMSSSVTIPCAIATGAIVGMLGGIINAAIALAGRIHPIVVTLGTLTIYRGLVVILLGGKPMTGLPSSFPRLAIDPETGFRGAFCLTVLVVIGIFCWLRHTVSGRHVYALGASETAARLVGISRQRVWLLAFGVGGMLSGLAGVVELAYSGQMQANLGAGKELGAIAIAVIGGVAITGGQGTVWGVILGAILLRLVNAALVHWGMPGEQIDLLVGGMILAAVLLDLFFRRRAA